ncbi:MAG: HAD family hydrolase [Proteobacteria bacterium]|jgi:phosphoglycolate phosphatase|nr:HAD family hydrolase [Pseudomonadota bacterium]
MLPTHIIFDLDGTLIDSAGAILASYRAAFASCGRVPARGIEADIVGPPLGETLRMLAGSEDSALIAQLADAFRRSYDSDGLLETQAYPGIGDMLRALRAAGMRLAIATNKRIHPTRLIVGHLGWADIFDSVTALDIFTPPLPDKAALLGRLLADSEIDARRAVYVGDRIEDGEAAEANDLPFIAATWGYGIPRAGAMSSRWFDATSPSELKQMLLGEK